MPPIGPDPLTLAQRLLDEGRNSEARGAARAAMAEISASDDPLLVGALQLVELRAALDMAPATEELARLCRDALNNVRGHADEESQARLCQLRIGFDLNDEAAARDAHTWLNERRRRLAAGPLAQLIMIEAQLAPSPAAKIEHMRRSIVLLQPGPEQLELRLVLAQVQLRHNQPTESLDELVEAAIAETGRHRVANMLGSLAWNHHDRLSPTALERVLEWTRERAPDIHGLLLAQTGHVSEAIALLTAAEATTDGVVRARCLELLLRMLPNGPERRHVAEQFEIVLEHDDDPVRRHNFAVAQAELAQHAHDVGLFERALANARRAAPQLNGVARGFIADILSQLIRLRCERATAELAELARELEEGLSADALRRSRLQN